MRWFRRRRRRARWSPAPLLDEAAHFPETYWEPVEKAHAATTYQFPSWWTRRAAS